MPFTFSHPVIALPFTKVSRKWLSMTGLIIGSMIPDFEYFIRMKTVSKYSHSLSGVFWFDLPLCIIVAFIFHSFVRNSLTFHLPRFLRSRFSSYTDFNWNKYFKKYWPIVIISSLLGIFSHLLWDNFTHANGYFVQKFIILRHPIEVAGISLHIYNLLQHLSSVAGGSIILVYIFRMPKNKIPPAKNMLHYWGSVCILFICIVILRMLFEFDPGRYVDLIMILIGAGMLSLIITGIFFTLMKEDNGASSKIT